VNHSMQSKRWLKLVTLIPCVVLRMTGESKLCKAQRERGSNEHLALCIDSGMEARHRCDNNVVEIVWVSELLAFDAGNLILSSAVLMSGSVRCAHLPARWDFIESFQRDGTFPLSLMRLSRAQLELSWHALIHHFAKIRSRLSHDL
jgi:hypothetical protein